MSASFASQDITVRVQESPAAAVPDVVPARLLPGTPLTRDQVRNINQSRSLLSSQLNSAVSRRDDLVEELRSLAPGVERAGVEERIKLLDQRILQIEADMDYTGQLLTSSTTGLVESSAPPAPFDQLNRQDVTMLSGLFIVFVMAPLSIALARLLWRRAIKGADPRESRETNRRLERMEQAVDTVAIEVERISEGQRFITNLFAADRTASPIRARLPDQQA